MLKHITFLMVTAVSIQVSAGTASCGFIEDHDERMMCMANSTRNSSYCSFIKKGDMRIRCFASLGK
jgi:hypothetical protein